MPSTRTCTCTWSLAQRSLHCITTASVTSCSAPLPWLTAFTHCCLPTYPPLTGQWIDEARSKSAGSLRIHMYHGQSRCRDPMKLACDYDIVVTTYQTLGADCGSRGRGAGPADPKAPIDVKGSPVGSIRWYRIIMDEGHTVKNAAVRQSKVMFGVQSERRWLCTGTPINNAVADLYGQFCALQLAPADKKAFFDLHWKNLYAGGRPGSASTLAFILKSTLIR